jgi:type IV pilus biogenesis protein CpaD/CtpE
MDTQRFVVGPLSALCIVALVMGTASAAIMTAGGTSNPDTGPVHHHLTPESILSELEQQGVDVTEVKTLLQNGDTDAVKAWLENYFQSNKPAMPDGSARAPPDLTDPTQHEKFISRLEDQGVDVTEVKTLLQNGDTDAVKAWLENYFQSNKPAMPDGSARSPPDLTNATQQQEIITRLEEKGVDVTEAEAELESGDTSAVRVWLDNYFHAHEGEMPYDHPWGEPPTEIPSGTSSQSNQ